jgi:hypothetical protein
MRIRIIAEKLRIYFRRLFLSSALISIAIGSQSAFAATTIVERHEGFDAFLTSISTITTSVNENGWWRYEFDNRWNRYDHKPSDDHSISLEIGHPDSKEYTVWDLDSSSRSYKEDILTSTTTKQNTISVNDSFGVEFSTNVCTVESAEYHSDPGPLVDVRGFKCRPYTISMDIVCQDKGKTINRYEYRKKLWVTDSQPALKQFRITGVSKGLWDYKTLMTFSETKTVSPENMHRTYSAALRAVMRGKHYIWGRVRRGLQAFNETEYVCTLLPFKEQELLEKIPGYPIRSISVILEVYHGKRRSFKSQEYDYHWQGGYRSLFPKYRVIPSWVLEVDPDFPDHGYGGHADLTELMDLRTEQPSSIFEIPAGYTNRNN